MDNIFNPFQQAEDSTTRRFGGTGLGLSICCQLVKAMGGEIYVSSKLGQGSVFRFTVQLPRSKKAISNKKLPRMHRLQEKITPSAMPTGETSLNILLADDVEDNRMVIAYFLEKTPHRITEAINGEYAVQIFKSAPFDLVLMDMHMPVLDGFGAAEQIRSWEREQGMSPTPIIALTADAMLRRYRENSPIRL